MNSRYIRWLIPIALVFAAAAWVVYPNNPGIHLALGETTLSRDITVRQGLDLQGGLQVLLEADLPADQAVDSNAMEATVSIVESRVNALGVTEPVVQRSGDRRLVVELPGVENTEEAIALLKQTGLLEFVDTGLESLAPGTMIQTDYGTTTTSAQPTPQTTDPAAEPTPVGPVYHTVMTGSALQSATVGLYNGQYTVDFTLTPEGERLFAEYTATHVGQYLTIVLDKQVISSPRIDGPITGGTGQITGRFTQEEANSLALSLRYGSLPVPLRIAESRTVGPTLGEDSVRRSMLAGAIGMAVVAIFMIAYYRLPGILAVLALVMYAFITFALFKLVPVTLTLPGIAGFVLSVGVAVDANILIFERMKEELRSGRRLVLSVEEGFRRAWPSIRDSNISTLITCAILFWFGSQFGASVVKGFALTLALGVFVSLFTAVSVTRTLLHAMLDNIDFSKRHSWFGI